MGNSATGSYRTTNAQTMAAFDKLPRSVRAALRDSVENWVPQPIRTMFERRGISAADCVKQIQKWDRDELVKRERQRSLASGPYKGNAPDNVAAYTRSKKIYRAEK